MIDKDLLADCLTGLDFPADVHTIVEQSEKNDCPHSMVSQLQVVAQPHLRVARRAPVPARRHRRVSPAVTRQD